MSCTEYETYELSMNAFRKFTSMKDGAEGKTLIGPKNRCKTEKPLELSTQNLVTQHKPYIFILLLP